MNYETLGKITWCLVVFATLLFALAGVMYAMGMAPCSCGEGGAG